eukprot:TRINITY_DN3870_c0_g1_i1.p1 TRINITY_DN3870_c0_g1~~TRINITY_DN3870_c0_g1_i1.p1  ORF type:complete len:200 (-),score=13.70 TRINITY_DN3870_c0_g1_i1:30-629(-)
MGAFGIRHEHEATKEILSSTKPSQKLYLTSPYFNFTPEYTNLILKGNCRTSVMVSSPESNGFFGGYGLKGYVPLVYARVFKEFFEKVEAADQLNRVNLRLFYEEHRTYHAKGLWITDPAQRYLISVVGSSNFGKRSLERDIESQMILLTESSWVIQMLERERELLWERSFPYTKEFTLFDRWELPFFLRPWMPLIKDYL